MCRKKKIKCDGRLPKCGHCSNYKTECVFTQVEKKRNPPKGSVWHLNRCCVLTLSSAKYIEGLENRLGRMESLLKMSGLLTEEEAGRTDLGTLEKRLADKATTNTSHRTESPKPSGSGTSSLNAPDSQRETPQLDTQSSPRDSAASPGTEGEKEKREDVENLSDLMCSLVTNNVGETRYIGNCT